MKRVVLNERRFKIGYILKKERVDPEVNYDHTKKRGERYEIVNRQPFTLTSAYTHAGHYIGTSKDAYFLYKTKGIKPELKTVESKVCSIGFCEAEQKWYGWSHRAIHGFGIGDEVKEGDCCNLSGWVEDYLEEHPEEDKSLPVGFKAETLEDAKKMAIAFAESVS